MATSRRRTTRRTAERLTFPAECAINIILLVLFLVERARLSEVDDDGVSLEARSDLLLTEKTSLPDGRIHRTCQCKNVDPC